MHACADYHVHIADFKWLRHYAKPEGRGLDSRWGHLILSIRLTLSAALAPGDHSASSRNEYQKQKNNVSVK
jgi:hypothetical protein